jgi:hypothetical protein
MGVGVQRHALAVLPPGKNRYALCRRLDRSQSRRKISPQPSFDPRPAGCKSLYRLSFPGPLKWGEGKGKVSSRMWGWYLCCTVPDAVEQYQFTAGGVPPLQLKRTECTLFIISILQKFFDVFLRAIKFHHRKFSGRVQALWCNVMFNCIW